MDSRSTIRQAAAQQRRGGIPLPELPSFPAPNLDLVDVFTQQIKGAGGGVASGTLDALSEWLGQQFPEAKQVASALPAPAIGDTTWKDTNNPHALETLDLFICEGIIGVAENGAVWLTEKQMVHRVAPFIAQHMVIVLNRAQMVWNMHQAYTAIGKAPFGLFVAGPSKTADIEQSLVIGAHGPRSLTVYLTG